MAKQDFIPDRDGDLLTWHDNFKTQVAALATKYGISTSQVTGVNTDNTNLHTDFSDADTKSTAAKSARGKKKTTKGTVTGNSRGVARQVKGHPAYDPNDGILMRIVGPEDTTDLNNEKPTLSARSVAAGHVAIEFNKRISDGVRITSKRGSETVFSFLAIDTESPYIDTRANLAPGPETRQYQAQYMVGDEPIGDLSLVLTVTVPG